MKLTISSEEVQSYINSLQIDSISDSSIDLDYQNAACVLYWFDPLQLYPFSIEQGAIVHAEKKEWINFFKFCDPVENRVSGNWWQLRQSIRRKALQRLQEKGKISEALANQDRVQDEEQKIYECLLGNQTIDIDHLSRSTLVILSGIVEWVKGILPNIDETSHRINRAIPMADLLAPMHRLADNFVGRKSELIQLAEYIGIVPASTSNIQAATRFITQFFVDIEKNPPFLIYGPGGVGKSTLLAKFILDNTHNSDKEPLPFAYLDIDKSVIDLEWPESFVMEAARQLSTQCFEQREALIRLKEELERMHRSYDSLEISKSYDSSGFAVQNFGSIVSTIKTPVLLIIDTFEEAQFLGEDVVDVVWRLLAELQKVTPNLRTVVAGRSLVNQYPIKDLKLTELSKDEAHELLAKGLDSLNLYNTDKTRDNVVENIIKIAGLNPMSLRLALTIVREQGIEKLKTVETKNLFFMRLREEIIQARLYGRILAHVHDEEVRKLAYPGLIVRRINPDIILSVLAVPCQLKIESKEQARDLFDKLSVDGALMSPDENNDALVHRPDVRKLMLEDLKSSVPAETIRSIHDLAVKYYSQKDDLISRAEEIYHRLSRGDDPELVAPRWINDIESKLRNALEELPVDARIWLSGKLGVTPDSSLLKKAGLEKWEEITARTAQRFLANGKADKAIEVMRERTERSPLSPLYRLELEALRLLGLYDEASFTADVALASLSGSASPEFIRVLLLQATLVKEAQDKLNESLEYIKEAEKLLTDQPDLLEAIRIFITHIRLLRKKGTAEDNERGLLIKKVLRMIIQDGNEMNDITLNELIEKKFRFQINNAIASILPGSPALLQEMVAELGKVVSQLIPYSLDYIGIDLRTDKQKNMLSKAFKDWSDELLVSSNSNIVELAERAGIEDNSIEKWRDYTNKNTGRMLGSAIQNWRYEIVAKEAKSESVYNFDKVLVDISRNNVEMSINKSVY